MQNLRTLNCREYNQRQLICETTPGNSDIPGCFIEGAAETSLEDRKNSLLSLNLTETQNAHPV